LSYTRARPINYHGRQAASTAISGYGAVSDLCSLAVLRAQRGP